MRTRTGRYLAWALMAGLATAAAADDTGGDWRTRPTLTGDWGGLRTRIADAGIRFNAHYTTESAGNVSGGVRRTARYTQQLDLETLFDLERLAGIPAARVQFTLTDRAGRSLSADALHNQFSVQELYGAGQNFRLAELNYRQTFAGERLTMQVGWAPLGDDLARLPNFCKFQNGVICGHANAMTTNSGAHNFPTAQWGGYVKLRPGGGFYATTGVFLNNPNAGNKDQGFNLSFKHTGKFLPIELGWERDGERPDRYIVGAYRNTAPTPDVLSDLHGHSAGFTGLPFLQHDGRSGGYAIVSRRVYNEATNPARGLSLGAMFGVGDRKTAIFRNFWVVGGVYQGTFRDRDDDFVSFMYARARTNPRLTQFQRDRDAVVPGALGIQTWEAIAEVDYGVRVTPWLQVRPNLQYVMNPGGTGRIGDALVIGLYTQVTF